MPIVHKLMDGEQAHNFAITLTKYGLIPVKKTLQDEELLVVFIFTNKHQFSRKSSTSKKYVVYSSLNDICSFVEYKFKDALKEPYTTCISCLFLLIK